MPLTGLLAKLSFKTVLLLLFLSLSQYNLNLNEGEVKDNLNCKRGNIVGESTRATRRRKMEGLSAVASLVGNNRERQIDLIKSMLTHLGSVDDKDNNASCEADASLVRSIRSSIATLKERNVGRMRLNDRIALQVILGATVSNLEEGAFSLQSIARLLGCNREKIEVPSSHYRGEADVRYIPAACILYPVGWAWKSE